MEGWSEEIILPELAKKLGYDLTRQEISIVNVASIAYLHFAKIFLRNDSKTMNIPVSIVTDLDNRPNAEGTFVAIEDEIESVKKRFRGLATLKNELGESSVTLHLAKEWTLEWCLFNSDALSNLFKEAVKDVHSGTDEFKRDAAQNFKPEFKNKLISKLKKETGTTGLDKVRIASELAEKVEKTATLVIDTDNDSHIKYLVDAIKHVCEYGN